MALNLAKMTNHSLKEIESAVYMTATLLAEALSSFGHAETILAYDASFKTPKPDPAGKKPKSAPALIALSEAPVNLSATDVNQIRLLAELKAQVLALVETGDLIPMGFKMPRASTDNPVEIDVTQFMSGEINWDKSEVLCGGTSFSAVRVLADEKKIKANKFHRAGSIVAETKSTGKLDFSVLSPERLVTEKEAAKYLGVSDRVMQGLRTKGGGPEFTKNGQAIRYKMADLAAWKNRQ